MRFERFEDLECLKEARILVKMVYDAVHSNRRFERDYGLKDQVTDAAVFSMSNIAEGHSFHFNKEFAQLLFISKDSVSEVESSLSVTLDQTHMNTDSLNEIYFQAEKVSKLTVGLINYLLKRGKNK